MPKLMLKPASADLAVLDPVDMKPLPLGGKEVEDSTYWRRRLRDAEVVETRQIVPAPPAPAPDVEEA